MLQKYKTTSNKWSGLINIIHFSDVAKLPIFRTLLLINMLQTAKNLIDLFFPKVCYSCNTLLTDNEKYVCTDCRHDLPVTNFHHSGDDFVLKIFYGRVKIEQATALLRFRKKDIVQQLLHNLKYRGYEDIGIFLGDWLGEELKTIENYNFIEAVIPVPLHKKKLKKRGYNQVAKFGKHIADALNCEYLDNVLIKISDTESQVFKGRFARWSNSNEVFSIQNKHLIGGKHILLVDDIITTGATIESCVNVLNQANGLKISVASMAIAN
ncbi:phosphoribosyltransferase family protein [Yeosuana sp. MJ-SS3]|uniref:Phosphoribosyltransferase family protein n=1 Tax=Gilvirhabdus luticola TaxID=3079858 RepID=A0ABU3U3C5_9FLAO|nr:phosphoribosyltransferase family protein [Yeosuana sp. MJ-SS3]MDU8884898.1 phosphoribosyltransferase family protein [Yeosuana sp. MJ-SS3]